MGWPAVTDIDRARVPWWLLVVSLGAVAALIAHAFVGVIALGLFGYYATRPICARFKRFVDSRSLAATLTVLVVLLPTLVFATIAAIRLFTQVQQLLGNAPAASVITRIAGLEALPQAQRDQLIKLVINPASVIGSGDSTWATLDTLLGVLQGLFGVLFVVSLAVTLSYVLLARGGELSDGLVELFGGEDTMAYDYALAVDADLESVFFGNLLFTLVMAILATVTYAVTNAIAPAGLQIPMVIVLGFLTGVASLVPLVVGKLVYVPVVAYLGIQALQAPRTALGFVVVVLVVYVLVLDLLPQAFIQPYLSGRRSDPIVLLFAYLLGPAMFGWYGLFLMPILFVLMIEAVRLVLPELLHGDIIRPEATVATDVGTDPESERQRREEAADSDKSEPESDPDTE